MSWRALNAVQTIQNSRFGYHKVNYNIPWDRRQQAPMPLVGEATGAVRAIVGLGSNVGNRVGHFRNALQQLRKLPGIEVLGTSRLYESKPLHVAEQPDFLNAICHLRTRLSPAELLVALKNLEETSGRDLREAQKRRFGPRSLDLDILYYGDKRVDIVLPDGRELTIPHPRMNERAFVLRPLAEIDPKLVPEAADPQGDLHPVFPASKDVLWQLDGRTHVMGILNVTPDSFSDGGRYEMNPSVAVEAALKQVEDGADIIDVGGESTRPGADDVEIPLELHRTIPVIQALREQSSIPISIDTRKAKVAAAAIEAGADIVNDVSGGEHDPAMLPTIQRMQVPAILMHMRGTPKTMQGLAKYDDVVMEVRDGLRHQAAKAQRLGINSWDIMLDPGIGFAKDHSQNIELLRGLAYLLDETEAADGETNVPFPLLVGASRKGFIGEIVGETDAQGRDWGSVGAAIAASAGDAFLIRAHNVRGTKQALQVWDAIRRAQ